MTVKDKKSGGLAERPTLDGCEDCYSFWWKCVAVLMPWSDYCEKKSADPQFKHTMTVSKQIASGITKRNFAPESVDRFNAGEDRYRRIKVIATEQQLKSMLNVTYLSATHLKGLETRMLPCEDEPGVWKLHYLFLSDEHPFRYAFDDLVAGGTPSMRHYGAGRSQLA